jgi:hypothetical protein
MDPYSQRASIGANRAAARPVPTIYLEPQSCAESELFRMPSHAVELRTRRSRSHTNERMHADALHRCMLLGQIRNE